ncbi:MAG: glycoside hydrolase family 73 protein [Saprospiraceae bacterium]
MKLIPKDFVSTYLPFAQKTEEMAKISAIAILAQAALESGWGEKAVGNMFFGIKAKASDPENRRQLVTTTEFLDSPNKGNLFPEVLSVEQVGPKRWKYKVKDWFRKYDTAEGSFNDHTLFFLTNKRYTEALKVGLNYEAFFAEIAKAGYATSPIYFETLVKVAKSIERNLPGAAAPVARRSVANPMLESAGSEELPELSEEDLRSMVPNRPKPRSVAKR